MKVRILTPKGVTTSIDNMMVDRSTMLDIIAHDHSWLQIEIGEAVVRIPINPVAPVDHLRRQFRDELFAELIANWQADPSIYHDVTGAEVMFKLDDWLRARKEQDDAQ